MAETSKYTKNTPSWLADLIAKEIKSKKVVLTGAREPEVHFYLQSRGIRIIPIALDAHHSTRYDRLVKLGKCSNWEEFLAQDRREAQMGLSEMLKCCNTTIFTSAYTSPEHIVHEIVNLLENEVV